MIIIMMMINICIIIIIPHGLQVPAVRGVVGREGARRVADREANEVGGA